MIPPIVIRVYVKLQSLVDIAWPVAFAHIASRFGILGFIPNVKCPPTGETEKEVEK